MISRDLHWARSAPYARPFSKLTDELRCLNDIAWEKIHSCDRAESTIQMKVEVLAKTNSRRGRIQERQQVVNESVERLNRLHRRGSETLISLNITIKMSPQDTGAATNLAQFYHLTTSLAYSVVSPRDFNVYEVLLRALICEVLNLGDDEIEVREDNVDTELVSHILKDRSFASSFTTCANGPEPANLRFQVEGSRHHKMGKERGDEDAQRGIERRQI